MSKNKENSWKIRQKISDHLIEAILIFASVFFAFWLTEYRESSKKAETLNISLKQIASEMVYNHKRIEFIFDYHSNLIQEIDSIKNQTDTDWEKLYGNNLKNWHGIQLPMLRSTAYQTFLNSGVTDNANLELAKSLADIYNMQSIIERFDNSFFNIASSDMELSALPKVRHLAEIYVGILPDLMKFYQLGKENWLYEYGYDMDIENDKLKSIVEIRMSY